MPTEIDIELRNRALRAFAVLTDARDGAIASFKLKHINVTEGVVDRDAREVHTKASKSFSTRFFPVGGAEMQIFSDWRLHLREEMLWSDDDPLFPKTDIGLGSEGGFAPIGLSRDGWKGAGPIRDKFRKAFTAADLPNFNPHSFCNTLVQLGDGACITPEEFKAWSQNPGHEKVLPAFTSYGSVAPHRQAELVRRIGQPKQNDVDETLIAVIAETFRIRKTGPRDFAVWRS